MDDVKQTYFGDHFEIHTGIKSLCCTPATNIVNQILHQLKKQKKV